METSVIDLLVPTDIQVDDIDGNTSKITLEPLERGFGHTLGNALRRILLSSMPGAAITDVTIEGISHEYSTIEGVREDVIDILLNLKDMPISLIEGTSAVIKLDVSGPCEVTSNSFEVPGNVELPDAEHHVASLVDKVSFSLTATVKTGRGYEPADTRNEEDTAEVLEGTEEAMITHFMQTIDKNIGKKSDKITDNMFADTFSESLELQMLNHRYEWKINFRTFVKTRAEGQSVNKKYEGYEAEVDDKMPHLTMVLTTLIASQKFKNDVYKLLKETNFNLDVGELFK